MLTRARTPGLVIRPAESGDAVPLAAVERDSLVPGSRGMSFSVDKVDALALSRMQPEPIVLAAELDGDVVGMHSASVFDALVAGQRKRVAWLHYPRVVPRHRGKWIGRSLQEELVSSVRPLTDHFYQLYSAGHDAEDGWFRWRTPPSWLLLDAGRIAGPPHGRPATAADAELIVEMLNAGHAREEFFLPHTVASLTARLQRAPTQYSWRDLLVGDGAVVGVWRSGWRLVRSHQSRIVSGAQDHVIDYGFLPGAENELLRLLRAACGPPGGTRADGYLGMWTSAGSPAYATLAVLTGREYPYALHSDIPEPTLAGHRGLHLDALHST